MKRNIEGADKVYAAAEQFVDRCLRKQDSLFTPGKAVWTQEVIEEVVRAFVNSPDNTPNKKFEVKLKEQLGRSSDAAKQLMAEILFVHLLPVVTYVIAAETKQRRIEEVLSWQSRAARLPDNLRSLLSLDLIDPGGYINQNRPDHLNYFVRAASYWWSLPSDQRNLALDDPWQFRAVLQGVPGGIDNTQLHLLLHLVFPNHFEDISSVNKKAEIVRRFKQPGDPEDLDRSLLVIRQRLSAEHGMNFSFFDPEVEKLWSSDRKASVSPAKLIVGPKPAATSQPTHLSLLLRRLNVVFYGPPGTGKTYAAIEVQRWWARTHGPDTVRSVTFHPSFAYEDFIEGYRPGAGGGFVLTSGVFREVCEAAEAKSDVPHLLIIDEINRGDVARLFGELITLVEADKRGSMTARLPYSKKEFTVPKNLHLLGTMNTADKSITVLDVALRRRFCFVEFPPDGSLISEANGCVEEVGGVKLGALLEAINGRLSEVGVDRDQAVGHAQLMIKSADGDALGVLRERVRYDLVPLVEEYLYADRGRMKRVFGNLVDEKGRARADVLEDDDKFKAAIKAITTETFGKGAAAATSGEEAADDDQNAE